MDNVKPRDQEQSRRPTTCDIGTRLDLWSILWGKITSFVQGPTSNTVMQPICWPSDSHAR